MSGFLNTSCDVMSVPRELEMQGLHFGLFLPWVQINSWFSMMHPFYYAKEEQDIYRFYVKLRYSLAPYIYSMALEAAQNGMPIVRSMPLCFPDDRNCDDMTYQYMFGDNFCVGIFTNDAFHPRMPHDSFPSPPYQDVPSLSDNCHEEEYTGYQNLLSHSFL